MGTTFRSLLSWDIHSVAVELVPSVAASFGFFHADTEEVLNNPKGRVIIDNGHRYLSRTSKKFDFITIDPPPPVEAAGSSLLYSHDFYQLVKAHLKEGGILRHWFPGGEKKTLQAVVRTISENFPHVKVFHSLEGWGFHFLASEQPLATPSVAEMIRRMPLSAKADAMEWYPERKLENFAATILQREYPVQRLLSEDFSLRITDDRPFNEYFMLRQTLDMMRGEYE